MARPMRFVLSLMAILAPIVLVAADEVHPFDDFSGPTIDLSKWRISESNPPVVQANGELIIPAGWAYAFSIESFLYATWEARFWVEGPPRDDITAGLRDGPLWKPYSVAFRISGPTMEDANVQAEVYDRSGQRIWIHIPNIDIAQPHVYRIEWLPGHTQRWFIDGQLVWEQHQIMDSPLPIMLYNARSPLHVDWVRMQIPLAGRREFRAVQRKVEGLEQLGAFMSDEALQERAAGLRSQLMSLAAKPDTGDEELARGLKSIDADTQALSAELLSPEVEQRFLDRARQGGFLPVPVEDKAASPASEAGFAGLEEVLGGRRAHIVSGIPFLLGTAPPRIIATGRETRDTVSIPVSGEASRLLFLFSSDQPRYGSEPDVPSPGDIFQVRMVYDDGTIDSAIPRCVASGAHEIYDADASEPQQYAAWVTYEEVEAGFKPAPRCIFLYDVPVPSRKPLREVQFCDLSTRSRFFIFALTLDLSERKPAREFPASWAGEPRTPKEVTPGTTALGPDEFVVENTGLRLTFRRNGTTWALQQIANEWTDPPDLLLRPLPDFLTISLAGRTLTLADFAGEFVPADERNGRLELQCLREGIDLAARIEFSASEEEIELGLSLSGADKDRAVPVFPNLPALRIGATIEDNFCFNPRHGNAISRRPHRLDVNYGWPACMQFVDLSSQPAGGGLCLLVKDLSNRAKTFSTWKDENECRLAIGYFEERTDAPSVVFPTTALAAHPGDWHAAFDAYCRWVRTWYRPHDPARRWYLRIFNDRALHHRHFLTADRQAYNNLEQADPENDLLKWAFYWAENWPEVDTQIGDYDRYIATGLEGFRKQLDEARRRGFRTGVYIDGTRTGLESKIGKAHGEAWAIRDPDGQPFIYYNGWCNCQALPEWQDYLSKTAARVAQETGVDGVYLDVTGIQTRSCYAPAHNHPTPAVWTFGPEGIFKKTRAELDRRGLHSVVVWTEDHSTDVNTQFFDGSYSSSAWPIHDLDPGEEATGINLNRFAFPDFKLIEIVGEVATEGFKRAVFNGNGFHGFLDNPELKPFWARLTHILRENADCFMSGRAQPLIPTMLPYLYANEFDAPDPASLRAIFTFNNGYYHTVRGDLISLAWVDGCRYVDLWTDREVSARRVEDRVILNFSIEPRDIAVLVREAQ